MAFAFTAAPEQSQRREMLSGWKPGRAPVRREQCSFATCFHATIGVYIHYTSEGLLLIWYQAYDGQRLALRLVVLPGPNSPGLVSWASTSTR